MRSDPELLAMSDQIALEKAGDESDERLQAAIHAAFTQEELLQLSRLLAEEINDLNRVQGRKETVRVLRLISEPTD